MVQLTRGMGYPDGEHTIVPDSPAAILKLSVGTDILDLSSGGGVLTLTTVTNIGTGATSADCVWQMYTPWLSMVAVSM